MWHIGRYLVLIALDAPQHPLLGRLELDRAMTLLNNISKEFDQAKGVSKQYCEVCMETLDADRFPHRHITQLCTHAPHSCRTCLSQSISSQLDFKSWDHISCPTCSAHLECGDIETFADADTVTRYPHPPQSVASPRPNLAEDITASCSPPPSRRTPASAPASGPAANSANSTSQAPQSPSCTAATAASKCATRTVSPGTTAKHAQNTTMI